MAWQQTRRQIADLYLRGQGIEIGALHAPLPLPPTAQVQYVDRMSENDLRHQYPELSKLPLVHVDVIDNGEILSKFADNSLDFAIANHFLEHTQDPIGAIATLLRVVKPRGIIYLAIPDKNMTFDSPRPITTFHHLLDDHKDGGRGSRLGHFEEFTRLVQKKSGAEYERELKRLLDMDYSIHYHVWDRAAITEFLDNVQSSLSFKLELNMQNEFEILNVLRKQ